MPDLSTQIETAAQGPKSHMVDGEQAVARNIDELIKADKYLKQTTAAASGRRMGGIRLGKMRSSGSTGAT